MSLPRLHLRNPALAAWIAALVGAASAACQVAPPESAFRPGSAHLPSPTFYQEEGGPTAPVRPTEPCTVTRIVDGDTLDCEPVGRIRLVGIDTPERDQAPFGALASQALGTLVSVGTELLAERDVEDRDAYDRALRYLWLDGVMVNWLMVRSGHAVLLTYPPNVQYVDVFRSAQDRARSAGDGLWSEAGFQCEPVAFRRGDCP